MMTGLKVWDRQGNLLTDITGRYPKLIHSLTIAERTNQTVSYTPPDGTELLVVPIYWGVTMRVSKPQPQPMKMTMIPTPTTFGVWTSQKQKTALPSPPKIITKRLSPSKYTGATYEVINKDKYDI